MPNGDKQFDKNELDNFFSNIADTLYAFAKRHNLRLTKYYHDSPSWEFAFRHPNRGIGKIEAARCGTNNIGFSCAWWHDDYASRTRFIKKHHGPLISIDSQRLTEELETCFTMLLSWIPGDWDEEYRNQNQWEANWSREDFDALVETYPIPRY